MLTIMYYLSFVLRHLSDTVHMNLAIFWKHSLELRKQAMSHLIHKFLCLYCIFIRVYGSETFNGNIDLDLVRYLSYICLDLLNLVINVREEKNDVWLIGANV